MNFSKLKNEIFKKLPYKDFKCFYWQISILTKKINRRDGNDNLVQTILWLIVLPIIFEIKIVTLYCCDVALNGLDYNFCGIMTTTCANMM